MKNTWKSSLIFCASLFILYLAIHYWGQAAQLIGVLVAAASSLMLGAVLAYIINILMSFYERKIAPKSKQPLWIKNKRSVCMMLAFLTLILSVVLLIRLIMPQLVQCVQILISALPAALRSLYAWLNENLNLSGFLEEQIALLPTTDIEWKNLIEKAAGVLISGVGGVMNAAVSVTSTVVGTVVTVFLSLIFMINILAGKEKLASQFDRLFTKTFGERIMQRIHHILSILDNCFHSYIVGQLIEALILGSLCAIGMWLLQLPYPLMIGALIGVMALIPIAGAYIGAALGAVMIFSVDPIKAVIFLVFLVILQQIEGNLIYPRTVGSSLQLPGIWVLAAVSIGGGVLGVIGMMIFVPLTAAAYRLLGEWVNHPVAAAIPEIPAIPEESAFASPDEPKKPASVPVKHAAKRPSKPRRKK